MFTGIIQDLGTLTKIKDLDDGRRMLIKPEDAQFEENYELGSSVAVDGVCLTVAELVAGGFWVDVSEESLSASNLAQRNRDDVVNLEPSLVVGDELGGHFVFGHVDNTVPVEGLSSRGDFYELEVEIPEEQKPFVARKGSLALDGVSLTVNDVSNNIVSIRIVPHTYENTRIKALEPGMNMNLEVDMLARYVYTSLHQSDSDQHAFPPDMIRDGEEN